MNATNNFIFFNTLQQFARDSSAGQAIIAAVNDVLTHVFGFYINKPLEETNAQTNPRWFSAQPVDIHEQVISLTKAIQKYSRQNGNKKCMRAACEKAGYRIEKSVYS